MSLPDHMEGFLELLEVSGADMVFEGAAFRVLVKTLEPKPQEFDLTPGDDNSVQVSLLAADAPAGLVRVGQTFTNSEGTSYRITRVKQTPGSGIVRLECTVTYQL